MTTDFSERHGQLLALAFAFASTCISFASTLELLNLQPTRPIIVLESNFQDLDI